MTRVLYHGAPRAERESILRHGLLRSKSETAQLAREQGLPDWANCGGIFFSEKPEGPNNPRIDVWEVNVDGLSLQRDETTEHEHLGERWWVTYDDPVVEPWRLRLFHPTMREWINLCETGWPYHHVPDDPSVWTFYHGTKRENLPSIMERGLQPKSSQSSQSAVYLAGSPGTAMDYQHMHYAQDDDWVILAIDGSKLDAERLGPDDYELADMMPDEDDDDPCAGMAWTDVGWVDSLRLSDQCVYHGTIPPEAIKVS